MASRSEKEISAQPSLVKQPVLNKHQLRTEATRRALLKAARRMFALHGFEACRIEDIAAASGRTRGSFYAHFKTKQDLFFAMFEQEIERYAEQGRKAMARCQTAQERIAARRDFYVGLNIDREWAMLKFEFRLFALRHPKLRAKLAGTHRRIRESALYNGALPINERAIPTALEVFLEALSLERAYDPGSLSRQDMTELLGRLFDALQYKSG